MNKYVRVHTTHSLLLPTLFCVTRRCFPSASVVLVGEDRSQPLRGDTYIPSFWLAKPCSELQRFSGAAQPGEVYTFQIAAVSEKDTADTVTTVSFDALKGAAHGGSIAASALNSMSTNGFDYWGRPMTLKQPLQPRHVKSLWVTAKVPKTTQADTYTGTAYVHLVSSATPVAIHVTLVVSGTVLEDGGDSEWWRGTRLAWLDSTDYQETTTVPYPFTPIVTQSGSVGFEAQLANKTLRVNEKGMLESATTYTDSSMGMVFTQPSTPVLSAPVSFDVLDGAKKRSYQWQSHMTEKSDMRLAWVSTSHNNEMSVTASVDATGYFDYTVDFVSQSDAPGSVNFVLRIPNFANNSVYGLGLGRRGGLLKNFAGPSGAFPIEWKWAGLRNGENGVWIGTTRAGLRLYLKGDSDLWQAGVPFDSSATPPIPQSWANGKSGGIRVLQNGTVEAYTGGVAGVKKGKKISFKFSMMITPTKNVDLEKHWGLKYAQLEGQTNYTFIAKGGATVVNMHQGNPVNPWINYPYLTQTIMQENAAAAHKNGLKFSVYNTMRELSNRAKELWAMRSINETYVYDASKEGQDVGRGADWLQEHIQTDYQVAWSNPISATFGFTKKSEQTPGYYPHAFEFDAAIKVKAMSRWNNYYVKGLAEIKANYAVNGIYLDEIAYDRVTMLRARKVFGNTGVIDHHSDHGQFESSPANNYMELYPFMDRLWYGEGFNYTEASADYWLTEISGLPYGLTSDMLRYAGMTPYHYKGLLHASANRWQCALDGPVGSCPFDPRAVWALWSSFRIEQSQMYGYWLAVEQPSFVLPVRTNHTDVFVTSYVKKGDATLIALSSFAASETTVTLEVQWDMLGVDKATAELVAPAMLPMQPKGQVWAPGASITVAPRQGWFILIKPKTRQHRQH